MFAIPQHIPVKSRLMVMLKELIHSCSAIAKDVFRIYEPVALGVRAVINQVPVQLEKGTMFNKQQSQQVDVGHLPMSAPIESTTAATVDVTQAARLLHFAHPVALEAEAFGVCVTRRHGANETDLITHESIRLLDILVAAKDFIGDCEDEAKQFPLWVIPSDSRDNKVRGLWLEIVMIDKAYLISLTDQ